MTERIQRLKAHIDQMNAAGVRYTRFYPLVYESLKTTKGEPVQIRRAKAQAYLLDHAPLAVLPEELFAGSMSGLCPVMAKPPTLEVQRKKAKQIIASYLSDKKTQGEKNTERADRNSVKTFEADFTMKESRWALMERVHHDADISYHDLQTLIADMQTSFEGQNIEKYEIGRELERGFKIDYGRDVHHEIDSLPWFAANHLSLNYGKIIRTGFSAFSAEIDAALKQAMVPETIEYYESAKIVCEAGIRFIKRYADTLRETSENESDAIRKAELGEMADICGVIAEQPAGSFQQAIQLMWMLHMMASFCWGSALSLGRLDQYMIAYYERDIKTGVMTRDEAKELLCCLWLKINEPRMRTVQSLTLGGITPDGEDAANELTALCLEVIKEIKLPYPNVGLRINKKNPDWLYTMTVDAVKKGGGQPMVMNDDVWITNLMRIGYDEKTANDYYNMGCVEIMLPGRQPNWGVTDPIAFPMLFEDVFNGYRNSELALDSFEDFKQAYYTVLKHKIEADKKEADSKASGMAERCYDPLASLMVDGCIESGKDMFQGGSELGTHWSFYAYGLGTAADAMAAVKRHVYDEKRLSIAQMTDILKNNFEGEETVRLMLEKETAHYGNDQDSVDMLADEILSVFDETVMAYNRPDSRDKYVTTLFGYFFHIYHGEITGATANGRRKGEAFSDSMGPTQGKDVTGPTGMLNSVLKLNHSGVTGGYALNLKVNPNLMNTPNGARALAALIKTYIHDGGPQLQIYVVDVDTLKKAKLAPDQYKNIIVRIGGYCEYFVNLDAALQDEIITRTTHG